MSIEGLPYLFLLIAIGFAWRADVRTSLSVLALAIISGLSLGNLQPLSLIWIGLLGLSLWLPDKLQLSTLKSAACKTLFMILALAMFQHVLPGFKNLLVFERHQFSADSAPFTMYLNFDKTLVGYFILLLLMKPKIGKAFDLKDFLITARLLSILLILMIPLALWTQYARIDIKFSHLAWIWILNNLFFVCLAEEALFRGMIQKGIHNLLPKNRNYVALGIFIAASLFGLAHFKGGLTYVALSGFAGLFYGYTYHKTQRLEFAILIHFGLNLVHFLFFSYPALAH